MIRSLTDISWYDAVPGEFFAASQETAAVIRRHWTRTPLAGLILGTGLGGLARLIDTECVLPYAELPHFPCATALSHAGRLVCGKLAGVPIVTMEGRCHLYEGYHAQEVTVPVGVMRALGAQTLLISNASGGLNPQLASGDLVLIADHINLMGGRARCTGRVTGEYAGWQGRGSPYTEELLEIAEVVARRQDIPARRGVYVSVVGPNYETRAEYRWMRRIGGDVVGMSTVPEALAAARCGLRVLAVSVVTNVARPDAPPHAVCAQEVVEAAERAETRVRALVMGTLQAIGAGELPAPQPPVAKVPGRKPLA